MNRRLRTGLFAAGGLLAGVAVATLIATYVVLQPERFTALLQSRAAAAGLELSLTSPASPTLWPKPALELKGVTLHATHADTPLLIASGGKIVLPWHTLLSGNTTISRLQVEGARIDLDALSAYVDTLPSRPSTAGAILPTIDAGFRVKSGTLTRGNTLVLGDVNIDAGRLANGRAFDLSLSATAGERPYALTLRTRPVLSRGVLTLEDLGFELSSHDHFATSLRGDATWRGGADIGASLSGRMTRTDASPFDIVLNVTPANERDPLFVALKLDGTDDHADLRLPPLALSQWWAGIAAGDSPTLPPLLGTVDAGSVEAGGVRATGVHIRATSDAPASASTVPAPAAGDTP